MALKKRAVLVHLNPLSSVTPLQGAYLKAYALADATVQREWDIDLYSKSIDTSAFQVLEDLVHLGPDLIGFSCYVWNMGLVRRALPTLHALLPRTRILLGGVQVIDQHRQYVRSDWDRVITCNAEGEKTFRDLLLQLTQPTPDLSRVNGITYQADGQAMTTAPQARIRSLDEIPSPWLTGLFRATEMSVALFETNRGCPYQCEFCYWGGAIGQKINGFTVDRIKDELTYIAKAQSVVLFLLDANFGIFPQDVEIAEHIARAYSKFGGPSRIHFSSAKNQPLRVGDITRLFVDSGLISTYPISLQTSSPKPLELAKRSNIKTSNYITLQRRLNASSVASFIELIWPLPGETLDSFKDCVTNLCANGAQSFIIYPLLLMNNVGYQERRHEFGLVTVAEESPASDGEMVIQTNEVSLDAYKQGIQFIIGLHIIHVLRGLYATMQLLTSCGVMRVRDVVDAFSQWLDETPQNPLARFREAELKQLDKWCDYRSDGALVEYLLHTAREDCDRTLYEFAMTLPGIDRPQYAELFETAIEFDLLNRPYAYHNTDFTLGVKLRKTRVLEAKSRTYVVEIPYNVPAMVRKLATGEALTAEDCQPTASRYRVSHRRKQIIRIPSRNSDNLQYCHALGREIAQFAPVWETLEPVAAGEQVRQLTTS